MNDHPNAAIVREGFEAFLQGDMDKIRALMDNDIEWTVLGNNPTAGVYKGKAEVIGYFGHLVMETEGSLELEIEDVIGSDDKVVIITNLRAKRNGKTLTSRALQVFGMNAIGKARTCMGPFSEDTAQIDDFWS